MNADERGLGWQLSGFRKVAHFIVPEGLWLWAACGVLWGESDAVTAKPALADTPKCKRCLHSKSVPRV